MKKFVFSLSIIFIFIYQLAEADCMRCELPAGSDLACTGHSKFDVITKCGQPDYSEVVAVDTQGSVSRWGDVNLQSSNIEKLYYNCGEGRFIRILTVKNGKVISISNEGRGSGKTKCY